MHRFWQGEERHRRIPEYRIAEGAELRQHVDGAAGLDSLPLVWDTSSA